MHILLSKPWCGALFTQRRHFFLVPRKRPHEPAAALSCEFAASNSFDLSHASSLLLHHPFPASITPTLSSTADPAVLQAAGADQMEQRHVAGLAAVLGQTLGSATHVTPGLARQGVRVYPTSAET